jgi:hypothetical protein
MLFYSLSNKVLAHAEIPHVACVNVGKLKLAFFSKLGLL